MKKNVKFNGTIKLMSWSSEGQPDGVVLDDGTYIEMPPYSLIDEKKFLVGVGITGVGTLIVDYPNMIFFQARIMRGSQVIADDSMNDKARAELKTKHDQDVAKKTKLKSKKANVSGRIAALSIHPEGEMNRIILEDGTSAHLSEKSELDSDELSIGDLVRITGSARAFPGGKYMNAHKVQLA